MEAGKDLSIARSLKANSSNLPNSKKGVPCKLSKIDKRPVERRFL
jgi:hypothetical protein